MTDALDETHDARRSSWVPSARAHPVFPLQNLPLGVFSAPGVTPRGGIAIGDEILDLRVALGAGLFTGEAERAARAAAGPDLNPLMALGGRPRQALRQRLFELLAEDGTGNEAARPHGERLLRKAAGCTLHVPAAIGDYTDFYAGIHHAWNGGVRNKRPAPLMPNYKHVPVAYHSRASSIVASGTAVRRPSGQLKMPDSDTPEFAPCRKLDIELEVGVWIGPGNALCETIPVARSGEHVVGLCLINDWSARDIQSWESAPLGPFLAKSFATTVSPWVVTIEALAPFRIAQPLRPEGDPRPLPYLWDDADQRNGAFEVTLEILILTPAMRVAGMPPHRISESNMRHLYWTVAQMIAHHTCGGCNLRPGDIFGTGTISAPQSSGWGSLAEITDDGRARFELPSGETRGFLEDGDEVILRARAERPGYASIGFGDCTGRILGA